MVALVLVATGCGSRSVVYDWELRKPPSPDSQQLALVMSYSGRGGGCTEYEGFRVEESDRAVTVTVTVGVRRGARTCTEDLTVQEIDVSLSRPLGTRELLGCGRPTCDRIAAAT